MKQYKLLGADGNFYMSDTPGTLGGNAKAKIYGSLDCYSALNAIRRFPGSYEKSRVFFADEKTALAAGYRPCAKCLRSKYVQYVLDPDGYRAQFIKKEAEEWEPKDYTPGFSVEDWTKLLENREIFTENALKVMQRMYDYGGQASCIQLANKYGEDANFYNSNSSALAIRISKNTNCPEPPEGKTGKWWKILYVCRKANKDEEGSYIWKLRDELAEAIRKANF